MNPDEHLVTFCRTDAKLADVASTYLLGAIGYGGAGIALVTPGHARQIDQQIAHAGIDPALARAGGSYVVVDAGVAINQIVTHGWPDPAAFWRSMSPLIQQAGNGGQRPVRVCGEMVSLLWQAGEFSAAVEVEALWNELARQRRIGLLCAYLDTSGADTDPDDELALLLAAHTRIAAAP
jgi:MEDS: MEthanogen/methylotroph, DcmR Sensory domain